ncbi:MAG: hypothetical protein NTW67_02820 [Candidatus Woesearchaeota archaeon]|nr:hypothetical protein [Candidatus Woesearchaeota archaeon]
MKINRALLWDLYHLKDEDFKREDVREWYAARVITKGTYDDVLGLGLENIRKYLPKIKIPERLRDFWEWYFKTTEQNADTN